VAYPLLLEVNSGSADTSDRTGRSYEVWLPLWEQPMDWENFQDLVTTDLAFRLKHQVIDTIDMLDVITQVDEYRELSRFARFGLWTRKGQGKYLIHVGLATPGESDFGAELRQWRFQARPTENQSQAQYNLLTAIQKTLYRLQQGNAEAMTIIRLLGQLEVLHSRISS
jgi:CRISPR-associated protein Csx17